MTWAFTVTANSAQAIVGTKSFNTRIFRHSQSMKLCWQGGRLCRVSSPRRISKFWKTTILASMRVCKMPTILLDFSYIHPIGALSATTGINQHRDFRERQTFFANLERRVENSTFSKSAALTCCNRDYLHIVTSALAEYSEESGELFNEPDMRR